MSFFSHLHQLISLFDRKLRFVLILGSILMTAMAALEALSIGAILPLISVLGNDEVLPDQGRVYDLSQWIGVSNSLEFMTICIAGLLALIIIKGLFSILTLHWINREAVVGRNRYASNAFDAFLAAPLEWHHHQNAATILRHLNSSSTQVYSGAVPAIIALISEAALSSFIAGILIYVSPVAAIICLIAGGVVSVFLSRTIAKPTDHYAAERYRLAVTVNKHVMETMSGIQDIRVLAREDLASQTHRAMLRSLGKATYMKSTIAQVPRYIFEVLAGGLILSVLIYLISVYDRTEIIPILSLFGVAAMRLLPTMARIVAAMNSLREARPATLDITEQVAAFGTWLTGRVQGSTHFRAPLRRVSLTREIELRSVTFSYGDQRPVLKNISMKIPRGETVGIVGPSGAGKSTLIGLLLGLYSPTSGEILVDGKPLDTTMSAYERSTGFVPQTVFLSDNTIEKNIVLGLPSEQIDQDKLYTGLANAQLLDFVQNLPEGLQTSVGENGVRLSGGQRQRVGIARALYDQPDILILDEATSSLDLETEAEITRVTQQLRGKNTVIIVAHRLSTIRDCDRIFMLENGNVVGEGTFDDLRANDQRFKDLVALGDLTA